MIQAIETEYNGVLYRSKLEATWAYFFDIMGWIHQYEPFILPGWIPDFILIGKKENVLVEVKPYVSLQEFYENDVITKIKKATLDNDREILLLGATILPIDYQNEASLGWLADKSLCFDQAPLLKSGFCHSTCSFHNRITGEYHGGDWYEVLTYKKGFELFNQAKNKFMWNRNNKIQHKPNIVYKRQKVELKRISKFEDDLKISENCLINDEKNLPLLYRISKELGITF